MNKVILVSVIVVGGMAAGWIVTARRLQRDLDEIRSRLEKLESRQKEPGLPPPGPAPRAEPAPPKVPEAAGVEAPPAAKAAPPVASPLTEEAVGKIVDQRLDARRRDPNEKREGPPPPFGHQPVLRDIAKELNLDPDTETRIAEIANTAKKQVFDLFKTPRADGTNLVDDMVNIMLQENAGPPWRNIRKFADEKVLGTDTSYADAFNAIREGANQQIRVMLNPDTYARYQQLSVNPENLQTGYDPMGDYLKQKGVTSPPPPFLSPR